MQQVLQCGRTSQVRPDSRCRGGASCSGRSPRPFVHTLRPPACSQRRPGVLLRPIADGSKQGVTEQDLDSQVESFMKRQAELESGAAFARGRDPDAIIGGDQVDEEMAKGYCREVFEILKGLKRSRDMSVAEIKLIVSIEDPRARERRANDIEDDRGVSRDEMASALLEVAEGRVPKDRIALKCLYDEISTWPFLEVTPTTPVGSDGKPAAPTPVTAPSDYASLLKEGVTGADGRDTIVRPYIMSDALRKNDRPQNLPDFLPDWVGYGVLYGISVIPVLITIGAVAVLFYNSLR